MAVILELAPDDTLVVGNGTRIRMVAKSGQRARLSIDSNEVVERVKAGDPVPAMAPLRGHHVAKPAPTEPQPFLRRGPTPP